MANIAYIRVSSSTQSFDRQDMLMKDLNIDRFFREKISGKNSSRTELQNMLKYVREGDVLYIESISRLGRSLQDLIAIVELLNDKGVGLISLKENYIDTTNATGKLVFQIFGAISEFERSRIRSLQAEGIKARKEKNLPTGRPRIVVAYDVDFKNYYKEWKYGKMKSVDFMRVLNLKRNTFYRVIKIYESKGSLNE